MYNYDYTNPYVLVEDVATAATITGDFREYKLYDETEAKK